ncbi:hypothetical protein ACJ72_06910 [Emergomyces africanus]|uniref:Uncharacterized protein n=1 Tax=Emergomyces africanus TaxID=1955775 RepID=A0A1B7NPR6_9EURO|nr:hypothetical protein ACJ72_06910 [Emergomyces africanus]
MGRTEPPFMYDPRSKNRFFGISDYFDPKAVTRASWAPPEPRMEIHGPLVNFNQHPDSYSVIPDGIINKKTMSPKTKGRVKYTRIFQLSLRVLALVGGLGMLFCVICINNTSGALSWMIRVAPGVSTLHTTYAIYHLCRSSAARTPASSASYMLFASILDAGLIPLYVLTGIVARVEQTNRTYGWGTLFGTKFAADTIIYATFLGCCVTAGLHLASFVLSIYLAVIFRKISKLPPDMNPLECDLTPRPKKLRRKSNIASISEKHLSDSTLGSLNFNRGSLAQEPLITPTRTVPFMHTRADSVEDGVGSAGQSFYSALSQRYSRSDLPSQQARQHQQSQHTPVAISRTAARGHGGASSRPQSSIISSTSKSESSRRGSPKMLSRDPSAVSSLSKDNWFVHPSSPSPPLHADRVSPLPHHLEFPDMGRDIGVKDWEDTADSYGFDRSDTVVRYRNENNYSPSSSYYEDDENIYNKEHTENLYAYEHDLGDKMGSNNTHQVVEEDNKTSPAVVLNPLEMNPPTPQPAEEQQLNSNDQTDSIHRIALTEVSNPSLNRPGSSTPVKSQSYADVDKNFAQTPKGFTPTSVARNSTPNRKRWTLGGGKPSTYESLQTDYDNDDDDYDESPAPRDSDRKGRVVSNSGIDLGPGFGSGSPGYGSYIAGLGVGRRRDVSGKVAEEGRGGGVSVVAEENETPTKLKGRRLSKTGGGEIKAAGWARFKGL